MKKLLFPACVLFILFTITIAWKTPTSKTIPVAIDLSSSLNMPSTFVIQNGCSVSTFADIQVSSPADSKGTALFRLEFNIGTALLPFTINEIDGQPSTQSSTVPFTLSPGKTVSLKVSFRFGGNSFGFNKSYLIKGKIKPQNHSFVDIVSTNDLLLKEIFVGSPNALCFKCIETENVTENVQYSFYIPGVDYPTGDCQKFPAYLSDPVPELKQPVSRQENDKVYFEFISNGVIDNTTVKKVLIKDGEGKFLTYHDGFPKFMDRIENDTHHYQDWTILRGVPTGCNGDREYKLVQYIDGNNCFELYQLKISGKYNLVYRTGVREEKKGERVIMGPKFQKSFPPQN